MYIYISISQQAWMKTPRWRRHWKPPCLNQRPPVGILRHRDSPWRRLQVERVQWVGLLFLPCPVPLVLHACGIQETTYQGLFSRFWLLPFVFRHRVLDFGDFESHESSAAGMTAQDVSPSSCPCLSFVFYLLSSSASFSNSWQCLWNDWLTVPCLVGYF